MKEHPKPAAFDTLLDKIYDFFDSFYFCADDGATDFTSLFIASGMCLYSDMFDGQEETFLAKPMCKVQIPDIIKAMLVDDWENVTKQQQLVPLPRHPNVRAILGEYAEYYKSTGRKPSATARSPPVLEEVLAGLRRRGHVEGAQDGALRGQVPPEDAADLAEADNADDRHGPLPCPA